MRNNPPYGGQLARPGQHPWVHGHTVDRDQLALVGRKATAIQRLASRHHLLVYFSGFNQETRQELGSHACCTFHGWRGRSPEALQWRVWRLPSCVWILSGTDSFFLHVGCTGCATPMGTSALIFPPIAGIGPTSIYFQSIIVVVILMLIMVMVTITEANTRTWRPHRSNSRILAAHMHQADQGRQGMMALPAWRNAKTFKKSPPKIRLGDGMFNWSRLSHPASLQGLRTWPQPSFSQAPWV